MIMHEYKKSSSTVGSVLGKKRKGGGSGDNERYNGRESDLGPTLWRLFNVYRLPMGTSSGKILLLQPHSVSHRHIGRTFIKLKALARINKLLFVLTLGLLSPSHLSPSSSLYVRSSFPSMLALYPLEAPSIQPDAVWFAHWVLGWWPFQPWY